MQDWLMHLTVLLNQTGTRFALVLFLIACFAILESCFPAHAKQALGSRVRNIVYIFFFFFFGTFALSLFFFLPDFSHELLSISGMAIIPVFLFSIFLSDLLFYWYHRAQHYFSWAWPLHELHHSDVNLNATSALRTYWLELPFQTFLIAAPVHLFMGSNSSLQLATLFLMTTWLLFTHANLKIHLGIFTPAITGPQLHRIHHSKLVHHQHKNFAQYFPIIDILFGTYYSPAKNEYPATGTPSLSSNASFSTVLLRPFRFWFSKLY